MIIQEDMEEDEPNHTQHHNNHNHNHHNHYKKLIEEKFKYLLETAKDEEWKEASYYDVGCENLKDIELFVRDSLVVSDSGDTQETSGIKMVKASGTVPETPKRLYNFLCSLDGEKKKYFDENLKEFTVVEKISTNVEMHRLIYSAPYPIQSREFLLLNVKKEETDVNTCNNIHNHNNHENNSNNKVFFLYSFSIQHEDYPEVSDYVRGEVKVNALLLYPSPDYPGYTYLVKISQVDPKGSIPDWLVNITKEKTADFIFVLRQMFFELKKHNHN